MKSFLIILFLLICCSCNNDSKKRRSNIHKYKEYFYIFEYSDLRNKDTNKIHQDTLLLVQQDDSAAYVEGFFLFERLKSDWIFSNLEKIKKPVSFKVLNTNFNSIKLKLSSQSLKDVDSIVAYKVKRDRNARFDSNGNIRSFDSTKKGLRNAIDSIILQKPIKDEKRPTKI